MKSSYISRSASDTEAYAKQLGQNLKGGEIIELISDLGGGKTTFVRGLAMGIGSNDTVSSPSFTIHNVYKSDNLSIFHYDFYRLNDPGILIHELREAIEDPNVVVAIEWSDIVKDAIELPHIVISMKPTDEDYREIVIDVPDNYKHINLKKLTS
ncbi:MAG: tRNA (adenosine(37)-N6)-threonylcarbamoyltransferase complex ATPase subunit type 1 TsaE [Candidatus Saccharimonadales bacterium]